MVQPAFKIVPGGLITIECDALQSIIDERRYWADIAKNLSQEYSNIMATCKILMDENRRMKDDPIMTPDEVAHRLNMTKETVLRKKLEIGCVPLGVKKIGFKKSAVEKYISDRVVDARNPYKRKALL